MDDKKVLLSIRDLFVKFRVRGRILTAIRGVSLDIYENETIAIVGESGCGKSVLTKTFAGMLDNNGFIEQGDILFHDENATKVSAPLDMTARRIITREEKWLKEKSLPENSAERLARDIYLSVSRYPRYKQPFLYRKLHRSLEKAMETGVDLSDERQLNHIFEDAVFRVSFEKEENGELFGDTCLNLAKTNCVADWTDIRGNRIATIFQDPMTSLNPILTIGSQITSVIIKHQHVSETEARKRAIILMDKVGIPNAEYRFDDYPFQYSGGMRQRIVIAIALSCQPKILICDEPTTALDVTIQAQILKLIKDLQKEFHYTTVFITHDLGVVANVADRVAVLYAGQIVEVGTAEEVFYDPRHPYTWVLLSSLPQLSDRGEELYSIAGTPPSLYNRIQGDAFAPRNPYCMKIDTLKEPPMFRVSDTHYARTWLLDPRSPKVEKPAIIKDINGKLREVFHIS